MGGGAAPPACTCLWFSAPDSGGFDVGEQSQQQEAPGSLPSPGGVGWEAQGLGRLPGCEKRLLTCEVSAHTLVGRGARVKTLPLLALFRPTSFLLVSTPLWGLCGFPVPPAWLRWNLYCLCCPDVFFLGSFREFCTLGGWSQRGTSFLSTQLPRLPEVGQHAPPSLSKLPDSVGCGQADVSNLH